jgi:hypothetical protein
MKDTTIDYSAISNLENPVVPTHVARFSVKNCPAITVNLLRVFLTSYIPTKRFANIVVECTDGMVIREHIVNRVQFLIVGRDTPVGKVKLSAANGGDSPLVIDSKLFKIAQLNSNPICSIRPGAIINIHADIEENTYVDVSHVRHNFISRFDRTGITVHDKNGVEDKECFDVEYNSGEVMVIYQDNITAKEVMSLAKSLIFKKLDEILATVVEEDKDCFVFSRGIATIRVKDDYSSIIVNSLLVYMYMADVESKDPHYYQLVDIHRYAESKLEVRDIQLPALKAIVKTAVENLKKDIGVIH